jgi:arylsulfatase A-like enzyme
VKELTRLGAAAAAAFASLMFGTSATAQGRAPNIVVIVADDLGYADLGVHGAKDIPTPHLDALAAGSTRFTDAYVSGPFCSPTRAGLMTGKYPQRFGYEFNLVGQFAATFGLPVEERTMADRLKAAGYRTALFGKWHLGSAPGFHPLERGFDEFFGFLGGQHNYMGATPGDSISLIEGHASVHEKAYLTDALADRAVDFVRRQRARPFFLYLAFNAVHLPMHATDKYLARFSHIADTQRRTYVAMLSAMDDGVGKTMAALRAERLEENTLIFFFSDNGGPTIHGGINGSSNAPLKGSKRQTWEGGIRVPFFIRWKGRLPEGRVDSRPIIQLDVLPTALAAAGVKPQSDWKFDGVNLLPFLTTRRTAVPHDALYWRLGAMVALRQGDWKLVSMHDGPPREESSPLGDVSQAELYNLKNDIGETRNLAAAHPGKVKEMARVWLAWSAQMAKPRFGFGGRGGPPPLERSSR